MEYKQKEDEESISITPTKKFNHNKPTKKAIKIQYLSVTVQKVNGISTKRTLRKSMSITHQKSFFTTNKKNTKKMHVYHSPKKFNPYKKREHYESQHPSLSI